MVTKSRFVILFQAAFVLIFAMGFLFPAGMVVYADDTTPTDTTGEVVTSEDPPPEGGSGEAVLPVAPLPPVPPVEDPTAPVDETGAPVTGEGAVPEVPAEVPAVPVDGAIVPLVEEPLVPAEVPPVVPLPELPAVVEAAPEEAPAETPAEIIEKLPDDAGLVLLDEMGEQVPLAAAEAEDIIINGDPMWCPGESAAGSAGCVPFGNLQNAINYAQSNPTNGYCTIYVESTYTSPNNIQIDIDQGDHPAVVLNMFIIGGVDLVSGSSTFGQVVGTTTLHQDVWIDDITGSMTLANFIFEEFNGNSIYLEVEDSNNVTLRNIDIDNTGSGNAIRVDDSNHVLIDRTEVHDYDRGFGIMVTDVNDLIIRNTNIYERGPGGGIYMNNVDGALLENLTVDAHDGGNNGPWQNDTNAITALKGSNLELRNVTASSNQTTGGWGLYAYDFTGYVNVFGGTFENNDVDGIYIVDAGAVLIRNAISRFNDDEGFYVHLVDSINLDGVSALNNGHMGGDLIANGGITVLNSTFSNNHGDGLSAISHNQFITLNGVTADGNGSDGADLDAHTYITVNNSHFGGNADYGLYAEALGDINIFGVTATGNNDDGVSLHTPRNITASCSVFTNNEDGFEGDATGPGSTITLNSNTYSGNMWAIDIWDGTLVENMNYPCGGGGTSGGGAGNPFVPPMLAGLIPVTGGVFSQLSCDGISVLQLPTGEETIFNQAMCGYQASMELVGKADIPGTIPGNYEFVNGFTVSLMFNNEVVNTLPAGASDTIVFPLTQQQSGNAFRILFWDSTSNGGLGNWVDLGGVREAQKWTKTHNQTGTFLLVK